MKLVLEAKDPASVRHLQGKRVFASLDCGEHEVGVILTYDPAKGLDVECATELMKGMQTLIRRQAAKEARQN